MSKSDFKQISIISSVFLAIEILSFLSFKFPAASPAIFIIIMVAVLAVSFYKLEYGILLAIAELLIGSLGHLFVLRAPMISIPIRLGIWLVVLFVFSVRLLRQFIKYKTQAPDWLSLKKFPGWLPFLFLFIAIIIGLASAIWRGHSWPLIFSDANAWLYFFLLAPLIAAYNTYDLKKNRILPNLFLAGALWLSLKTIFLLFVFTHDLNFSPDLYLWLRKTLVGEMTPTTGGWPRIFIQGQIYAAVAFFGVFWRKIWNFKIKESWHPDNRLALISAGLFLSTILISFSRSFWVALIGTLIVSLVALCYLKSWRVAGKAVIWIALSGLISFAIIYLVVAFPYIHKPSTDFSTSLIDRVSNGNEAALASRWSLLPVLSERIRQSFLLGEGYGATITYFSSDPRILQNNPSGEYTTYAFEWGYLDLWLKIGLIGLLAYLYLMFRLVLTAWRRGQQEQEPIFFMLAAGIIFLAITNAFTPYLNHPLGIGFLIVSSCLIWPNRVY